MLSFHKPKPKPVAKKTSTEGKKRKRGRLTKEEEGGMKRTCRNIFSWLAPPPNEVLEKVPEIEVEVENMEVVDRDREERLENVRRKKLQ